MGRKTFSFLAVPPKDKRIQHYRVRFSMIVFVGIIILGGIAGFLIPFNALTLDVVELNQKKHLTDQNLKLLARIKNMREKFFVLRSKVDTLKQTKESMSALIDLDSHSIGLDTALYEYLKTLSLDDILGRVNTIQTFFDGFVEKVNKNPKYMNYLPVDVGGVGANQEIDDIGHFPGVSDSVE